MAKATCRECGAELTASTEVCPECGATYPTREKKVGRYVAQDGLPEENGWEGTEIGFWLVVGALIVAVAVYLIVTL